MRAWILGLLLFLISTSNFAQDIKVFFNHSGPTQFTEPYRKIERQGDNFEAAITQEFDKAKSSIHLAVQELTLPNIAKSLISKHRAGIEVQVVIENEYDLSFSSLSPKEVAALPDYFQGKYRDWKLMADTNLDGDLSIDEAKAADTLLQLRSAGIKVINDTAGGTKGSALMHHKFAVIDNVNIVTTSANFSHSDFFGDFGRPDTRGNPNSLIIFHEASELAQAFEQEFEILWGKKGVASRFSTKKPWRPSRSVQIGKWGSVQVSFSPITRAGNQDDSSQGLIEHAIGLANTSVDFLLFVFSEQQIADRMREANDRGVVITGLVEPDFAWRWYSEVLDLLGVEMVGLNCRFESPNSPWKTGIQTVGTPKLPEGDRLHHKMAVVDDRWTLMGSHNWSAAAQSKNDEFLMLIDSPAIAKQFKQEIKARFQKAYWGIPSWLLRSIDEKSKKCAQGDPELNQGGNDYEQEYD